MKFGQVDDLDKVDFSLPTLDKITKTNLKLDGVRSLWLFQIPTKH